MMNVRRILMLGLQIRGTHPYQFRSGEWASVCGIVSVVPSEGTEERLCWHVGFDDGVYDHWPMTEQYEFKERQ